MRARGATAIAGLLAATVVAGCGGSGSSGGLSDSVRSDYIAGCVSAGQKQAGCACTYDQLTKQEGIDTEAKLKDLQSKLQAATKSANPAAAVPPEFRRAVVACRSAFQ
jgi:hypothetical protein